MRALVVRADEDAGTACTHHRLDLVPVVNPASMHLVAAAPRLDLDTGVDLKLQLGIDEVGIVEDEGYHRRLGGGSGAHVTQFGCYLLNAAARRFADPALARERA